MSEAKDRTRIDLGEDLIGKKRCDVAIKRAVKILKSNLGGKGLWLRITLWDEMDYEILDNPVLFGIKSNLEYDLLDDGSLVLYYFLSEFEESKVSNLVKSSVYYEMGLEPSINMTCLYFNFEIPFVANIYDDRGMDLITKTI